MTPGIVELLWWIRLAAFVIVAASIVGLGLLLAPPWSVCSSFRRPPRIVPFLAVIVMASFVSMACTIVLLPA